MEYGRIIRYSGRRPCGEYTLVAKVDSFFFLFLSWEVRLASKIFRHFVEMNYYEKLRFCFSKIDDVCHAYVYCSLVRVCWSYNWMDKVGEKMMYIA